MRKLKVVGLDVDGRQIICEADGSGEKFLLVHDDRLRAAVRGDKTGSTTARETSPTNDEGQSVLRPKEIQARIRSGASVEQVASASGVDRARVERFAHPVLLERSRAAELATAAHPVLADGPSVLTLLETVTTSLVARGLGAEATNWDAWRTEDGRWTVRLAWKAGRSDLKAHFRFAPGAHGGTVTSLDDPASELIDPNFARPLRPVAVVPQLELEDMPEPLVEPELDLRPEPAAEPAPPAAPKPRARKGKPAVPAWEDVLLGVRSSGQR